MNFEQEGSFPIMNDYDAYVTENAAENANDVHDTQKRKSRYPSAINTSVSSARMRASPYSPSSPFVTSYTPDYPPPNSPADFNPYYQPPLPPSSPSILDECIKEYLRSPALIPTPPLDESQQMYTPLLRQHQLEFFMCPEPGCGKRFLKQYNLNSHARVHSTAKPHVCKSCPLAFKRKHDLGKGFPDLVVRHGKLVHKQCHLCDESFGSSPDLTNHLIEVHHYPHLAKAKKEAPNSAGAIS